MTIPLRTDRDLAMAKVADNWSTEFTFEDIEISEDGVHFGSFWGTAELALNDPRDRDFVVRHISVNGQKRERQTLNGYSLSVMKRVEAVMQLPRPAPDDRTFRGHLFRKIADALYASREAAEHFANELEDQ